MFGSWPLWQRHWDGLLLSRTWLAGQIQILLSVLSGILLPGHTHWCRLLVSRTRSPGQKHSSGLLGSGTWLPGQPGHLLQVFIHFFHTFFLLHLFLFFNFLHFLGDFLSLHLPLLNNIFFPEKQNSSDQGSRMGNNTKLLGIFVVCIGLFSPPVYVKNYLAGVIKNVKWQALESVNSQKSKMKEFNTLIFNLDFYLVNKVNLNLT